MGNFYDGHWRSEYLYTGSDYDAYQSWLRGEISNRGFRIQTDDGDGTAALKLPSGHVDGGHSYTEHEIGGPTADRMVLEGGAWDNPEEWTVRSHRTTDETETDTSQPEPDQSDNYDRTLSFEPSEIQRSIWGETLDDQERSGLIDAAVQAVGGSVSHFGGPKRWMLDNTSYEEAEVVETEGEEYTVGLTDTGMPQLNDPTDDSGSSSSPSDGQDTGGGSNSSPIPDEIPSDGQDTGGGSDSSPIPDEIPTDIDSDRLKQALPALAAAGGLIALLGGGSS